MEVFYIEKTSHTLIPEYEEHSIKNSVPIHLSDELVSTHSAPERQMTKMQ